MYIFFHSHRMHQTCSGNKPDSTQVCERTYLKFTFSLVYISLATMNTNWSIIRFLWFCGSLPSFWIGNKFWRMENVASCSCHCLSLLSHRCVVKEHEDTVMVDPWRLGLESGSQRVHIKCYGSFIAMMGAVCKLSGKAWQTGAYLFCSSSTVLSDFTYKTQVQRWN